MDKIHDVLILGGGPGGYTAALYCARAGLDTLVVEKLSAGGQMALTQQIDNYPGFEEGIDGFTLGERMQQGAERFGARTLLAEAHSAELTGPVKKIHTSEGTLQARAVILATGAGARPLGLEREDEFTGRGLYYCAACDGMACRGKKVVVVGGGNTAAADALLLSRLCEKVILVHRRGTLKATKIYHEPLFKAPNLEFHWNSQVTALLGEDRLSGVEIRQNETGKITRLDCAGIFVSIGRSPATELFRGQLELDEGGYIQADETTRTSLPGVFAVGDVRTKAVRQVVTAVGDGAAASHFAEEYLAGLDASH